MRAGITRLFGKLPPEPRWIDAATLRQRLAGSDPPLVIDVRGPDEFDGPLGHIEGARNIPLPDLQAHATEIADAARPVVFVCLTDKRSSAAAAQFVRLPDVTVLRGGMRAWREGG